MATTPEAKEYMRTLEYLAFPCDRAIKTGRRCNGCAHPRCRGFMFDPDDYRAAWLRLGELGTEEVFADLNDGERGLFWLICLAMQYMDDDEGPQWTPETASAYLDHLIDSGEANRFIERFIEFEEDDDDPVLY